MGKSKKDDKKHRPRPFNCCEMPIIDPCPHSFCIVERARRDGVNPERPKGLPWSTGLLKEMPGTGPRYIPYHFPETTYPSTSTAVCRPSPEQGRRKEAKKLKTVMDVCDQMMYFLKIIMLANELLEEEKKGGGGGEKPPEGAPPAQPAEAPPALPAQEAPPAPPTQEAPSAPPTQDAPPEAPVQEAPPQPPPEG